MGCECETCIGVRLGVAVICGARTRQRKFRSNDMQACASGGGYLHGCPLKPSRRRGWAPRPPPVRMIILQRSTALSLWPPRALPTHILTRSCTRQTCVESAQHTHIWLARALGARNGSARRRCTLLGNMRTRYYRTGAAARPLMSSRATQPLQLICAQISGQEMMKALPMQGFPTWWFCVRKGNF